MATALSVVSPVGVIQKLPRIPFETLVENSLLVTDSRVPSERATASSRTSIACAAVTANRRSGLKPSFFEKDATNRAPSPLRRPIAGPGELMIIPSAAVPARREVAGSQARDG